MKATLHNTDKERFFIKGITISCDCMTVEYDWMRFRPEGKLQ
ncbi:MAG: hypothetical protein SOX26_12075 [Phocaeicola sp.]|nr:hypothetical protein [Phocaeicola sp.]